MIDKVSNDFKGKVSELTDEQKRRLADVLIDRVLVGEDEEKNMVVEIIFKFNVDIEDKRDDNVELSDSKGKEKSTTMGAVNSVNGTPSRIGTHG